jgi:hypothetical protein
MRRLISGPPSRSPAPSRSSGREADTSGDGECRHVWITRSDRCTECGQTAKEIVNRSLRDAIDVIRAGKPLPEGAPQNRQGSQADPGAGWITSVYRDGKRL